MSGVAGIVAGYCRKQIISVSDLGGVPRETIRRHVAGIQENSVAIKLDFTHTDIIAGGGTNCYGEQHRSRHNRSYH